MRYLAVFVNDNMKKEENKSQASERKAKERHIDRLSQETYTWWKKSFVLIKKTKVRTWKGVFLIAFAAGLAVAVTWTVSFNFHAFLEAGSETATLMLDPDIKSVTVGDTFDVDIILDTRNSNVVVTRAIVNYDTEYFKFESYDTSNSVFASGNSCLNENESCGIVNNDSEAGIIDITLAKPSPGVKTSSGLISNLTFKALKEFDSDADNIFISFAKTENYDDSDVILDNGKGTDILAGVMNIGVRISNPVCTDFDYSEWGSCQSQTRTITANYPNGCTGGKPSLTQECDYTAPACTDFDYSEWGSCQADVSN